MDSGTGVRETPWEKSGEEERRGEGGERERQSENVTGRHGTGGILWRDAFETTFTFPISVSRHASALNWTEKVPYMLYHHGLDLQNTKALSCFE